MEKRRFLFTSESVGEGHPDKVCDQISDGVLDCVLKQDPYGRVACETYVTMGLLIVGGEITTTGFVDVHNLTRDILKEIGYDHPKYGFDYHTCAIINTIHTQSPDIAQGVDSGGAGRPGAYGWLCLQRDPGADAFTDYARAPAGEEDCRCQKGQDLEIFRPGLQEPGYGRVC